MFTVGKVIIVPFVEKYFKNSLLPEILYPD